MTSFTRTQVYLDPDDHESLKRLAAIRGQSMTTLVREAVARYVAEEVADDLPAIDEIVRELYEDPLYEGIAPGVNGFVARMQARASAERQGDAHIDRLDRELGVALAVEHERQRRAWEQRNPGSRSTASGEPT